MNIVALDVSTKKTGICIMYPNTKRVYINTLHRKRKISGNFLKDIHPPDMYDSIIDYMSVKRLTTHKELLIVIEEYNPGRNQRGKGAVPWMQGYIVGRLHESHILSSNIHFVNPSIWKHALIGRKTIGKELVEESSYERALELNLDLKVESHDDDSFDAFGMAYWAKVSLLDKSKKNNKKVLY